MIFKIVLISIISRFLNNLKWASRKRGWLDFILILCIRSNHPRRLGLISEKLKKKCRFPIFKSALTESSDLPFVSFVSRLKPSCRKTLIIYAGDSLVEYYSRIDFDNPKDLIVCAYWLGPITRLGFLSNDLYEEHLQNIKFIYKLLRLRNGEFDKVFFCWSSGSIDVRCSVFELLKLGAYRDLCSLRVAYREATSHLMVEFLDKVSSILGNAEVVLLEEQNSFVEGLSPDCYAEFKRLRIENSYPAFGSILDRVEYRSVLSLESQCCLAGGEIKFKRTADFFQRSDFFDGVHPNNAAKIEELNESIILE